MNGRAAIFWVALVGGLAFGLFQVKYAVQSLEDDLAALNRDLLASEESIHVLRAEWAYLNRPDRLAGLAERHLDLAPMTPSQVGGIEALPFRTGGDGAPLGRAVLGRAVLAGVANPL